MNGNQEQQPRCSDALQSTHPTFLKYLDSDPKRAYEEFAKACYQLFRIRPPRLLQAVPKNDREDMIQSFLLRLYERDALRHYKARGFRFSSWINSSFYHFIIDRWREAGIDEIDLEEALECADPRPSCLEAQVTDEETQVRRKAAGKDLEVVADFFDGLQPVDREMLILAARGKRPRQIVAELGLRDDGTTKSTINKKCSDRVRYLRGVLMNQVRLGRLSTQDHTDEADLDWIDAGLQTT